MIAVTKELSDAQGTDRRRSPALTHGCLLQVSNTRVGIHEAAFSHVLPNAQLFVHPPPPLLS